MEELKQILEEQLDSDNGTKLREQLTIRAKWQSFVALEHRKAKRALVEARVRLIQPAEQHDGYKVVKVSVEDRKIALEGATAELSQAADELADIAKILSEHISLGQSLLRSLEAEIKGNLR